MSDYTHDPVQRDLQHRSWHANPTVPTYNPTNQGPAPLELLHPITIPHSPPHSRLKTADSFETRRPYSHVPGHGPCLQHTMPDFARRTPVKEMTTKPPSGAPAIGLYGERIGYRPQYSPAQTILRTNTSHRAIKSRWLQHQSLPFPQAPIRVGPLPDQYAGNETTCGPLDRFQYHRLQCRF